jgi:hypothetical protein
MDVRNNAQAYDFVPEVSAAARWRVLCQDIVRMCRKGW